MYKIAYYIHQYQYNQTPAHTQEDMAWIRSNGFDGVAMVVNEVDLVKGDRNIDRVFSAAKAQGLKMHLVPSRWGGLVAGTPGIKSAFSSSHPDDLMRSKDGSVQAGALWGALASVHSPATFQFFCDNFSAVLSRWPFDGIIWDEPKGFRTEDYSTHAMKTRPEGADVQWDNQQFAHFFDRAGKFLKEKYPGIRLSMFVYATMPQEVLDCCTGIEHLDDFGIDGNPFIQKRETDKQGKTLLENGKKIMELSHRAGKNGLMLIENFDLTLEETKLMDQSLPEILSYASQPEDVLMAYYYGRNNEDPDEVMQILSKHINV